jgi:hypothetical protein
MNRTIKDATVNHIVSRPQATHLRPLRRPHSPCLLRSPPRTVAAPLAAQPVVDLVTAMEPARPIRTPLSIVHRNLLCQGVQRPLESAQYVSIKYTERLAEAGIEPSVGSVGDSYDNALAETINGLYKAEVIHRRGPWRSFEAVEFATLEWIDWFNHRRLLEPIGNIQPAEAEEHYYATLDQPAMAAWLKRNSLRQTRVGSQPCCRSGRTTQGKRSFGWR